eukprot:SAG22_NODE_18620_length_284_cov_0.778378_2_plen_20_part_01
MAYSCVQHALTCSSCQAAVG